jgi:O-antigen/teichoic acid export membrane protein
MEDRNKPDSLLNTLVAVGRFGLMLIGIIGISVEMFRDDGWLKQLIGKAFSSPSALLLIPLVIGVLYVLDKIISNAAGKPSSKGDIPLYIMMAIGAFFLFRFITTGSF